MKKLYFTLGLLSIISTAYAIRYDLKSDSTITDVANPKFTGAVQMSTMTAPGMPAAGKGKIYVKSDNRVYFKNSAGLEYNLTASGGGGASSLSVMRNAVQISSPTAELNFSGYFTASESPANRANIYLDTTTLVSDLDILTQAGAAGVYLSLSSATATYLNKAGTAADSLKLGGQVASYYISGASVTANYLGKWGTAVDSQLLGGYDSDHFLDISSATATYLQQVSASNTYLTKSSATATYLNQVGKAADSNLLDNLDSTWFLSQSSATATYWQTKGWEQYYSKVAGRVQNSTNTYTVGYSSASKFYGNGASLTGIVSGINLKEDTVTKQAGATAIDFTKYLNVSATGVVDVDSTTLNATTLKSLYSIVIGTYSSYGITYVCDGTADDVQFNQATAAVPVGGTIFIMPGTYTFNNVSSITVQGATIKSVGAILKHTDRGFVTAGVFFYVNANNITFDGIVFDGTSFSNSYQWLSLQSNSDYWRVTNCTFQNQVSKTNSIIFAPQAGADSGIMSHCQFISDPGSYCIINYGSSNLYTDIQFFSCGGLFSLRGSYNTINDLYINGSANTAVSMESLHSSCLNSMFLNSTYASGIQISGDYNRASNNAFYNMAGAAVNQGCIDIPSGGDYNVVIGNTFNTIGGTGDNDMGINCDGIGAIVQGNSFTGNIDKYCIDIGGNNNIVTGNEMDGATGMLDWIANSGTGNVVQNNRLVTENYELAYTSQTASGKPNFIPSFTGTQTMTVDYNLWTSTGIANIGSWDVVGGPSNYAQFSTTFTHTSLGTSSENLVRWGSEDIKQNITHSLVTNPSRVTIPSAGTYFINFSIVVVASGVNKHIIIWLKVDGVNVPNTATILETPISGETLIAVDLVYKFSTNQYFEIAWASRDDTGMTLLQTAAAASPTTPVSPAGILVVHSVK